MKVLARNKIVASGLSRLYQKMQMSDCAIISAFRGQYSHSENLQRSKSLLAKIARPTLDITKVDGSYVENFGQPNAKEVNELSYFVCFKDGQNPNNIDLKKLIMDLGEQFDQDSIFWLPKQSSQAELIGTNDADFPGYHKVVYFSKMSLGKDSQFMTKIGKRPFAFVSCCEKSFIPSVTSMAGILAVRDLDWTSL